MAVKKASVTDLNSQELLSLVRGLVEIFKVEKWLYNVTTILSFLFLLTCAIIMITKGFCENVNLVYGMFGSSGVIALTSGRLLKMWNDVIKFVSENYKSKNG